MLQLQLVLRVKKNIKNVSGKLLFLCPYLICALKERPEGPLRSEEDEDDPGRPGEEPDDDEGGDGAVDEAGVNQPDANDAAKSTGGGADAQTEGPVEKIFFPMISTVGKEA